MWQMKFAALILCLTVAACISPTHGRVRSRAAPDALMSQGRSLFNDNPWSTRALGPTRDPWEAKRSVHSPGRAAIQRLGLGRASLCPASILPWIPGTVLGLLIGTGVANWLQDGPRKHLGRTQEEILGVPVKKATAADVAKLGESWLRTQRTR